MTRLTGEDAQRLADILDKEYALLTEYHGQTARQTELIAAGETDGLNASLARRQRIFEQIKGLHQEKELLMQSYVSLTNQPGVKKIELIETRREKNKSLIAEIAEIDEKNMAAARNQSKEFARQIDKANMSRKSIGAYGQGVINTTELFDTTR